MLIMWLLVLSFGLFSAYQLIPESETRYDRFFVSIPLKSGGRYVETITNQAYIDYICTRIGLVVLYLAFSIVCHENFVLLSKFMMYMMFVYIGYVIDFVIIFNQPYFYFGPSKIPIMYSTVIFFVLAGGLITLTLKSLINGSGSLRD